VAGVRALLNRIHAAGKIDQVRRAFQCPAISNESLINQAGRLFESVSNRLSSVSADGF
jgi:hypothetical protein